MLENVNVCTSYLREFFPPTDYRSREMFMVALIKHIFPTDIYMAAFDDHDVDFKFDSEVMRQEIKDLLTDYSAEGLKKHFKTVTAENRAKAIAMCKIFINGFSISYTDTEVNYPEKGRLCFLRDFIVD